MMQLQRYRRKANELLPRYLLGFFQPNNILLQRAIMVGIARKSVGMVVKEEGGGGVAVEEEEEGG